MLVLLAVVGVCWPRAGGAHQAPTLVAPAGELGQTPPPLIGSKAFFSEALSRLRPRCDETEAATLDDIERLLNNAEQVRWGNAQRVDPRVADYLRWKAEQRLVELLEALPGLVRIDPAEYPPAEAPTLAVDPSHKSILFRIAGDEGPPVLRVVDWTLQGEAFDRTAELVAADAGVTYALVRLVEVPEDLTTIRFSVRRESGTAPLTWRALALRSPAYGRLRVSLRDETGELTHALLAIRSANGGVLHEPATALDFRQQLNEVVGPPVSEPGKGYMFFLPGAKRGRFWIVPGDNDLTLPLGDYEVIAQRGPEHRPTTAKVTLSRDQPSRVDLSLERWTDQPSAGWWSGDDHVHARLMSGADADRLLAYAEAVDLHVANILEMGDPLRTYYAQRGFGKDYRVERNGRWLIPGQEDPRSDLGHAIALNLAGKVRDTSRYLDNVWIAEQVHAQEGLYGHTHVGPNACFVHREMALFTPRGIVDFNSIMQAALGTELYYDFLNLGFKMTASAGADTPYGGTMGAVRVYAHAGKEGPLDPQRWFDAIKQGRTFVTNGPMPQLSVNGAGPGESVDLRRGQSVQVNATVAGDPGWSSPKRLELIHRGRVVASESSPNADCERLSIHRELRIDDGGWIAVRAFGHDGSETHTTPVYVTVGEDWHGDRQSVPSLVDKQLAVLHEIEHMLADAQTAASDQRRPMDLVSRNTAAQAAGVREQVERARRYYLGLRERVRGSASP